MNLRIYTGPMGGRKIAQAIVAVNGRDAGDFKRSTHSEIGGRRAVVCGQKGQPAHSLNQIDRAGRAILDPDLALQGIDVLNSWRVSHRYPLNALRMTLRNRCMRIDAVVSGSRIVSSTNDLVIPRLSICSSAYSSERIIAEAF
jgi:hypothetical protein